MQTALVDRYRRFFKIFLIAFVLSFIFGCTTTLLMARCNDWTHQGLSDDSFQNNYRIGVTIHECASKCSCSNDKLLINCESGEKGDCFKDCAKNWDVECGGWTETPVAVDFITLRPVEK